MQAIYEEIEKYIKKLNKDKEQLLIDFNEEMNKIDIKLIGLNEFRNSISANHKLKIVERKESISSESSKFMDNKDVKKVNLFLEFLDKCGEATEFKIIRKQMPKIEYYIYNKKKRLWNGFQEFRNDYKSWLNREGYWTNAIPKPDNRPDDIKYPIMIRNKSE